MTAPVPASPDPAELWDYLRGKGLSEADATRHVMLMLNNQPANVRQQYLKDVDPGLLASFGLGAADMMSFGLGKQVAAALDRAAPESDRSYSALTEEAAHAIHPTAHFAGEAAGVLLPVAGEAGLARAGVKVAPTALGAAVRGIESRVGRAAAKTVLNAATGAGYAGAQAAGRTVGSIPDRLRAAGRAAPIGAAVGALLPLGIAGVKATAGPTVNRFLDAVAGKAPARPAGLLAPEAAPGVTHFAGNAVEDIAQAQADFAAGRISKGDFDTAMEMAGQSMQGRPGLLTPTNLPPAIGPPSMRTVTPDPLDVPTFQRPGLLKAEGPLPEAWQGTTPQAGGVGGHSYSGTYPRILPVANAAKAQAALRGMSIADLQRAWSAPQVPKALRSLIEAEFQRRMVTLPSGLLAAPIP